MASRDGASVTSEKKRDIDVVEKSNASINSGPGDDDVTVEEERKLVRRLDRRIMPIICLMYLGDCMTYFFLRHIMIAEFCTRSSP